MDGTHYFWINLCPTHATIYSLVRVRNANEHKFAPLQKSYGVVANPNTKNGETTATPIQI
jgi:hypothetical protein